MILFETLNQSKIFILLAIFGFLSGFVFDFAKFVGVFLKSKTIKILMDFLSVTASFFVLFIVNLQFNYNQLRLYVFIVFFAFVVLQRILFANLLEKFITSCYTKIVKNKKQSKIIQRKKFIWNKKFKKNLK